MGKELGIPYMGSKRKLSSKIVDYILSKNRDCKYVYDLFGGGGAISFGFLQRKQIKKVVYNELNTGVCELLKKIQKDGVTKDFYKWVSREEFNLHKNDDDWYGGLLKTCWSFGNNVEKGYLFGEHIEESKRLLHEIILNKCDVSINKFNDLTGILIDKKHLENNDMTKRRTAVMGILRREKGRGDLESLQNLQQLQNLQVDRSQMLEMLQQLEKINMLRQLQNLQISNNGYQDVIIETPINETILYLDPPYFNTAKYAKDLCHIELMDYILNSPYKIYVSSYEFDLPCVFELNHRSSLSATNNAKKVVEKLFCNREENSYGSLF